MGGWGAFLPARAVRQVASKRVANRAEHAEQARHRPLEPGVGPSQPAMSNA